MTEFMLIAVAAELAFKVFVAVVTIVFNGIGLVRAIDKDGRGVLEVKVTSVLIHDVCCIVLIQVDVTELNFA